MALPNGIDCRPYGGVPTVRSESSRPLQLVYIGRIAREKGLYETLQGLRLAHEKAVDLGLLECRAVGSLAGEQMARLRGEIEQLRVHEMVVDDHVGLAEQREAAMVDESEIAGSGPDEVDNALFLLGHGATIAVRPWLSSVSK